MYDQLWMFGIYQARVLAEYKVMWIITKIKKFISKTIDYIYFDYMYFIWVFFVDRVILFVC